jgi:hypothetical protein
LFFDLIDAMTRDLPLRFEWSAVATLYGNPRFNPHDFDEGT